MKCVDPNNSCGCAACQAVARSNQESADKGRMKARISRNDWALIREALEMLATDYEEEHPEQSRLNFLLEYASLKERGV